MDLYDDIYDTLIGNFIPEYALPWVPNAFTQGSACEQAYRRMMEARDRIEERLGTEDDEDIHCMLIEMDTIQRLLCRAVMELRRM